MEKMTLCYLSKEREERICLELKLAMAKGQAASAQKLADKLATLMAVLALGKE